MLGRGLTSNRLMATYRDGGQASSNLGCVALHALPVAALVLALIYYWFARADRYIVFLYYHDMGPLITDTAPFSAITSSRYWMAGLVAGGIAGVLYTGVCGLVGRLERYYQPPPWWQVWAAASVPVLIGVPAITMTVNAPTLPVLNAGQATTVALLGLALAVAPARLAARHPRWLIALAVDGGGVAGIVLAVALSERIVWMLARGIAWPLAMLMLGLGGSVGVLLLMTVWLAWRRSRIPRPVEVCVAGLWVMHLGLPLLHHLLFTDGYYYITNASNFMSQSWGLQVVAWAVGAAAAQGISAARRRLANRLAGR